VKPGERIGYGATADIYAWGDGQVLKLLHEGMPAEHAREEAEATRLAYAAGIPAPATGDLIEVDGRQAIVFERLSGPSMLQRIGARPWTLPRYARLLAELQVATHRSSAPSLPPLRRRLARNIEWNDSLPEPTKKAVLNVLGRLPDGDCLCHGDLHPDNVLLTPRGPVIIDWTTAARGNRVADLARTCLLLRLGQAPEG